MSPLWGGHPELLGEWNYQGGNRINIEQGYEVQSHWRTGEGPISCSTLEGLTQGMRELQFLSFSIPQTCLRVAPGGTRSRNLHFVDRWQSTSINERTPPTKPAGARSWEWEQVASKCSREVIREGQGHHLLRNCTRGRGGSLWTQELL